MSWGRALGTHFYSVYRRVGEVGGSHQRHPPNFFLFCVFSIHSTTRKCPIRKNTTSKSWEVNRGGFMEPWGPGSRLPRLNCPSWYAHSSRSFSSESGTSKIMSAKAYFQNRKWCSAARKQLIIPGVRRTKERHIQFIPQTKELCHLTFPRIFKTGVRL